MFCRSTRCPPTLDEELLLRLAGKKKRGDPPGSQAFGAGEARGAALAYCSTSWFLMA